VIETLAGFRPSGADGSRPSAWSGARSCADPEGTKPINRASGVDVEVAFAPTAGGAARPAFSSAMRGSRTLEFEPEPDEAECAGDVSSAPGNRSASARP